VVSKDVEKNNGRLDCVVDVVYEEEEEGRGEETFPGGGTRGGVTRWLGYGK